MDSPVFQRDFARRVRIGVVGVGGHAYRTILPTLTFLPVELVAVADIDPDLTARTAAQYGVRGYPSADAMLAQESLDAVVLCVSPQAHPALAVSAFRAGLHVWMEKPAAVGVAGVDAMLAERGDQVAVVGYKKAFMPATCKALELIENKELGTLRTVLAVYPMSVPARAQVSPDDGEPRLWRANGCHPLSFLVTVAGPVSSLTVHRGLDDSGVVVLRHENGVVSNLHLALGAAPSQPNERYTVFGDGCTLEIENSRAVWFQRGIPFGPDTTSFAAGGSNTGAVRWEAQDSMNTLDCRPEMTQGVYGSLDHFLSCILERRLPTSGTLEFARHLAQLHQAAMLSDGQPIEIGAQQ